MLGMQGPFERLLVLLDYDGTVTARECNELVLQRFTGDAWRQHEEALQRGLIGHAECLRRQIGLVRVPRAALIAAAVGVADLAPGFDPFLRELSEGGARIAVVSAGFREVIDAVWRREALPPLEVLASEIVGERPPFDVAFHPAFGDCPACGPASCKGAVVRALRRPGEVVAVFGDGHADVCMAREADLVFARGTLAALCDAEGIACAALGDFRETLTALRRALPAPQSAETHA